MPDTETLTVPFAVFFYKKVQAGWEMFEEKFPRRVRWGGTDAAKIYLAIMSAITTQLKTGTWDQSTVVRLGALLWLTVSLTCVPGSTARAETVILHLKNGDRIGGEIISEDTNRVVITTSWTKELNIPASEIERRESGIKVVSSPRSNVTNSTSLALAKTKTVVEPKPKNWKIEARAGADFLSGPKNQQIYYGRLKYAYTHPYLANPAHSFRNVLDYSVDYGTTQPAESSANKKSILSANRMYASDKTDFDFGKGSWFVYDLAGAGYDEVRKIDVQYEIGPGLGYHFITRPSLQLNFEGGVEYQEQYRSDNTTTKNLYFRISEDSTWKINHSVTFSERAEFLPRADSTDFRARAESTLSYALWRNVSVNLSLLDLYDTKPAQSIANNDLQVHTSVGVTF